MRNVIAVLVSVAVFAMSVGEANAQVFRGSAKAVVNPPGLFNRSVARARGGVGGAGFAQASVGVPVVPVAAVGVKAVGFHGHHGVNAVAFRGVNAVAFNPVNTGFFVANASLPVSQANIAFVNQGRVRFNAFGTRTVVDDFGNVFEVDAFGNALVRGNRLGAAGFGFPTVGVANFGGFRAAGFRGAAVGVGGVSAVAAVGGFRGVGVTTRSCFGCLH